MKTIATVVNRLQWVTRPVLGGANSRIPIGLPRNEEVITSNPGPAVGMGLCQDSRQTMYAVGGQ
jgi:hypothetical protein